jgi:hypothetical protein
MSASKDFLSGLLFFLIGAAAIIVARDYPFGTAARMGSGYFPTVLGGILVLIGAFLMLRGARSREQGPPLLTWGWRPLACIVLSMVLFGFLLPRAGLVPSLIALFFVSAAGGRNFRLREVLVLCVVMTALAAVVFVYLLKLPFQLLPGVYWV